MMLLQMAFLPPSDSNHQLRWHALSSDIQASLLLALYNQRLTPSHIFKAADLADAELLKACGLD